MRRLLVGMVLCIGVMVSSRANAQVTYEGCVMDSGMPVASIRNDRIQDIAMASLVPTQTGIVPVIYFNMQILSWANAPTRVFFYAHECAHHILGHVLTGLRLGQEQEADCWAIRSLVDQGLFSDAEINAVQDNLARFGRTDWTHLPGPQRAINLRRCLGQ